MKKLTQNALFVSIGLFTLSCSQDLNDPKPKAQNVATFEVVDYKSNLSNSRLSESGLIITTTSLSEAEIENQDYITLIYLNEEVKVYGEEEILDQVIASNSITVGLDENATNLIDGINEENNQILSIGGIFQSAGGFTRADSELNLLKNETN